MRITWDLAKAAENLRRHGVRFEEAADVLRDPFALTREDLRHDEPRFVTLGATLTGTLLVVVYAYAGEQDIRLISARDASRAERRQYADAPRG
jgi:uncharacterized DUF497 family protein